TTHLLFELHPLLLPANQQLGLHDDSLSCSFYLTVCEQVCPPQVTHLTLPLHCGHSTRPEHRD
ncbi:hypothetical protein INR49_006730, partial [Caranx melampygus]